MLTKSNIKPDFGYSNNAIIKLSRRVPISVRHKFHFDNYYATLSLKLHLEKTGTLMLGTIQRNKISICKLPDEKSFKILSRGSSFKYTTTVDCFDVSSPAWIDNKIVTMLSFFVGINCVKNSIILTKIK